MLADYVITLAVSQQKADSSKKIRGEAQVDFLLCRDAECSQLVDLQTVSATLDDGTRSKPFLGIPFSGIAGSVGLGVAAATATDIDRQLVLAPVLDKWVPPELNDSAETKVHQVQYNAGNAERHVLNLTAMFGDLLSGFEPFPTLLGRAETIRNASQLLTNTNQYWINASEEAEYVTLLDSWGLFEYPQLETAMQRLVVNAGRLLHEQAKQELAITDTTKSVGGALLDIIVTLVAIVAMASGSC